MAKKEMSADDMVKDLWSKVQKLKIAVAKAEKPDWKTSGEFRPDPNAGHGGFNIRTCTDNGRLLDGMASVILREGSHTEAREILGIKGEFKHLGFTRDEWENDFVTRAGQNDIVRKKEMLRKGEEKLRVLLPEEERKKLEAASIAEDLKDLLEED